MNEIPVIEMEITSTPITPVARSFNITDSMRFNALLDLAHFGVELIPLYVGVWALRVRNDECWEILAIGETPKDAIDSYIVTFMPEAAIPRKETWNQMI